MTCTQEHVAFMRDPRLLVKIPFHVLQGRIFSTRVRTPRYRTTSNRSSNKIIKMDIAMQPFSDRPSRMSPPSNHRPGCYDFGIHSVLRARITDSFDRHRTRDSHDRNSDVRGNFILLPSHNHHGNVHPSTGNSL